jgi:hypothetical protein
MLHNGDRKPIFPPARKGREQEISDWLPSPPGERRAAKCPLMLRSVNRRPRKTASPGRCETSDIRWKNEFFQKTLTLWYFSRLLSKTAAFPEN